MKNIKSAICRRKKLCVLICIIFMLLITLVMGPWMLLWTVHYKEGVYENDRRFWLLKYYGKMLQPYNIKSSTGPYDIQKLP